MTILSVPARHVKPGPAIVAAAAVALAACGDGTGTVPAEQQQAANGEPPIEANHAVPSAAPSVYGPNGGDEDDAADPAMQWSFGRTAEGPRLAYGVPQTDNVRLMLRCPTGSGPVILSFIRPQDVAQGRPSSLTIASGREQQYVTIEREQGPLGTTVGVELPVSAAPLQRFRAGQNLELHWGEETIRVPGATGEAERFFGACE